MSKKIIAFTLQKKYTKSFGKHKHYYILAQLSRKKKFLENIVM